MNNWMSEWMNRKQELFGTSKGINGRNKEKQKKVIETNIKCTWYTSMRMPLRDSSLCAMNIIVCNEYHCVQWIGANFKKLQWNMNPHFLEYPTLTSLNILIVSKDQEQLILHRDWWECKMLHWFWKMVW